MTESKYNKDALLARLAGKWQIPLLVVGVLAFAGACVVLLFSRPGPTWDQQYAALVQRVENVSPESYGQILREVRLLNQAVESDDMARRAAGHALEADIHWRVLESEASSDPKHWVAMRDQYIRAIRCGLTKTADIAERQAEAAKALGEEKAAVAQYKEAARLDPSRATAMYQRVIMLRRSMSGIDDDQWLAELAEYMELEGLPVDEYGWAVDESVGQLIRRKLFQQAAELIGRQQARRLGGRYDHQLLYQRARLLAAEGLTEQADNVLISLTQDIEPASPLYLKALLLRGQLIWDANPAEAEGLFKEILARAANSPIATAATFGLGRAYGRMRLYDEAIAKYAKAVKALAGEGTNPYVDPAKVRKALIDGHERLLQAKRPAKALQLAEIEQELVHLPGVTLTDRERIDLLRRLSGGHSAVAKALDVKIQRSQRDLADEVELARLREQRRTHLRDAGDSLMAIADLASLPDDEMYGDSLWTAAAIYDRAGLRSDAIEALKRFIAGLPGDVRTPEGRFLLGQALQADGQYDEAIEVYKANLAARVPVSRHVKAVEGQIPMARCYIAKGPKFFEEAEKILQDVTSGQEGVTPESELYRQALFGLGRLYHRQGKWRQARRALAEAVQRDPGKPVPAGASDPQGNRWRFIRATESMYLMADSYQQSAAKMAEEAVDADPAKRVQLREAAAAQLTQAAKLHRQVIERFESLGDLTPSGQAYRRNSYFSVADCLSDLGKYPEALSAYEKAVFLFQRRPEALGGLIAIYNCHYALGNRDKAEAAMERAAELKKHIKYNDGDLPVEQTRPIEWDRWLKSVAYLDPDVSAEE